MKHATPSRTLALLTYSHSKICIYCYLELCLMMSFNKWLLGSKELFCVYCATVQDQWGRLMRLKGLSFSHSV